MTRCAGQGASPATAVLLYLLLPAGHDPRHLSAGHSIEKFHELCTIQLNDTHPSIGVAELMRLLIDIIVSDGTKAWEDHLAAPSTTPITRFCRKRSSAGPADVCFAVAPSHRDHLRNQLALSGPPFASVFPGETPRVTRMSTHRRVREKKYVRMAYLACVGSKHINGVAKLHT